MANNYSIARAFEDAETIIENQLEFASQRKASKDRRKIVLGQFPWRILWRPGAENIKDWNLPEAANNHLVGIPPIPEQHFLKLPKTPFLALQQFSKKDAAIFFGRGKQIQELYSKLSNRPPLILLYGQSGVGKSSLLASGLYPRLEEQFWVVYAKRDPRIGLTATFESVLLNLVKELKLALITEKEKDEAHIKIKEIEASIPGAQGHIRKKLQKELDELQFLLNSNIDSFSIWKAIENGQEKTLVVIIDQIEEAFTHLKGTRQEDELSGFLK